MRVVGYGRTGRHEHDTACCDGLLSAVCGKVTLMRTNVSLF